MAMLKIPVVKGAGSVEVDTDAETGIQEKYYEAALTAGLKVLVNGGASKIVAPTNKDDAAAMATYHAAAMAKAQERVKAMVSGTLNLRGRSAAVKGPSGEVMTEARRLARQAVKDALKAAGQKVTHYSAADITQAANVMLADDSPAEGEPGSPDYKSAGAGPALIAMAEAAIAKRKEKPTKVDLSFLKPDAKLVAKAEETKAAKKANAGTLSKTQAGKVAPRANLH